MIQLTEEEYQLLINIKITTKKYLLEYRKTYDHNTSPELNKALDSMVTSIIEHDNFKKEIKK
jgi:hypothetical protein